METMTVGRALSVLNQDGQVFVVAPFATLRALLDHAKEQGVETEFAVNKKAYAGNPGEYFVRVKGAE